jgi:hypothetical protein
MTETTNRLGMAPMAPDSMVYDREGRELGKLAEMRESYFKVNVRMARDYWLPVHLIEQVDGDRITLSVAEDVLEQEKLDSGIEDLTQTDIEEATDDTLNPLPVERRYEAEADYLTHPHPLT